VRKRVSGTADVPRLSVFRSLNHIYAQVIDDRAGRTLAAACSLTSDLRRAGDSSKTERARAIGRRVAQLAIERGIQRVVFDRGGHAYHGRVKALAEAAREAGLQF
jgi:large subunit ribosomal protein L18